MTQSLREMLEDFAYHLDMMQRKSITIKDVETKVREWAKSKVSNTYTIGSMKPYEVGYNKAIEQALKNLSEEA